MPTITQKYIFSGGGKEAVGE